MKPYYSDDAVTLYHGDCLDLMGELDDGSITHVITDPPYSKHVHGSSRSRRMQSANDRGGRYGADLRRNVDLGFDHITEDDMVRASAHFGRLAQRWVLTFSDVESCHLWRGHLIEQQENYCEVIANRLERIGASLFDEEGA